MKLVFFSIIKFSIIKFSIIKYRNGEFSINDGTLFSIPPELKDNYRVSKYKELSNNGWHITEFGYSTLIRSDSFGNQYILPGLFLIDAHTPTKKFYGYKPIFSKSQVEQYLNNHFARNSEVHEKADKDLTALVHDLRHLSGSIYHSATEAQDSLQAGDYRQAQESLKTVIATQTMLKVRTDYLDFSSDSERFTGSEKIPVYSRVDKVVRCFRAAARVKKIEIRLTGESYRLAEGPNILDIVPYTIIDNAIKYGRNGSKIIVQVYDTEYKTTVLITSHSPIIFPEEANSIFDRGFRGINAKIVVESGTGIGLSVAKQIVENFNGDISVNVGEESNVYDKIDYRDISFKFSVPTHGDDERRRAKHGQRRRRSI